MRLLDKAEFESWVAAGGMVTDAVDELVFSSAPDLWAAWETPRAASDLPGFVSAALKAAAPKGPFTFFLRGGVPWLTGTRWGEGPLVEQIRDRIVGTLDLPSGFAGAIQLPVERWGEAMMLVVTLLVFGWCVSDDLQVIPGDRSCVLMTSHHGYIAVHFPDRQRLESFTAVMTASRFPAAGSEENEEAAG